MQKPINSSTIRLQAFRRSAPSLRSFWSVTKPVAPVPKEEIPSPPPPTPVIPTEPETPLLDPSLSKDFVGSLNTVLSPDAVASSVNTLTDITKFGDLKSLGLCHNNPVGLAQYLLEAVHLTTGLPWWGTVVAATVLIRLFLFPIVLKTQRNGAKLQNLKPVLEPLNEELVAARKLNDTAKIQATVFKMRQVYKSAGTSPFSVLWGLAQAPVFLSFFFALRAMAELPVPGFEAGGFGFVKDLTMMDSTYILPIIASGTMLAVMELGTEAGAGMQQGAQAMKTVFRAMILLFIPLTASLPSAIFMYWVPSNFFTLGQFLLLRNPRVKSLLKIPIIKQEKVIKASSGMSAHTPPSYFTSLQMVRESMKRRSKV
ncbi:Mitochondrial inner membrane protein oxa1l [Dinochytrium kinnereticum]|nr:Mitochondrial inner membrane protein oxa1l [Dinochytrium kinnereticum]